MPRSEKLPTYFVGTATHSVDARHARKDEQPENYQQQRQVQRTTGRNRSKTKATHNAQYTAAGRPRRQDPCRPHAFTAEATRKAEAKTQSAQPAANRGEKRRENDHKHMHTMASPQLFSRMLRETSEGTVRAGSETASRSCTERTEHELLWCTKIAVQPPSHHTTMQSQKPRIGGNQERGAGAHRGLLMMTFRDMRAQKRSSAPTNHVHDGELRLQQ